MGKIQKQREFYYGCYQYDNKKHKIVNENERTGEVELNGYI